jgi:hypothetical protein
MVPLEGTSKPATRFNKVVFPHPLAPSKQTNSPCAMERETLSRTIEAPPGKRFDIPLMSSDTD